MLYVFISGYQSKITNKSNNKKNRKSKKQEEEDYRNDNRDGNRDDYDDNKKIRKRNEKVEKNTKLMLKCDDGTISESGICKKRSGDECITSAECPDQNFCFNNICTRKPVTWDECFKTTCNEGVICLDRHIMKLVNNKFIMLSGWWSIGGCIDICDSSIQSYVYVLTDDGLYHLSIENINPNKIRDEKPFSLPYINLNGLVEFVDKKIDDNTKNDILSKNPRIIRIFIFRGAIHCLAENGKIYRGFSLREAREILKHQVLKWDWEQIQFLSGRDISEESIIDVAVYHDELITLTLSDYDKIYNKAGDEHSYQFKTPTRRLTCKTSQNNGVYNSKWNEEIILSKNYQSKQSDSHIISLPWTSDPNLTRNDVIKYGPNHQVSLHIKNRTAILKHHNGDILYYIDRVHDAVIDPQNLSSLIVISSSGIKRYRLVKTLPDGTYSDYRITLDQIEQDINEFSVINELIEGNGDTLLTTDNYVWLITKRQCIRI